MIVKLNDRTFIVKFQHKVEKEPILQDEKPHDLIGGTFCYIKEAIPGFKKEDYPVVSTGNTFLVAEDRYKFSKVNARKVALTRALLGIKLWFDPKKGKAIRINYRGKLIEDFIPPFSKEERAAFWSQYLKECNPLKKNRLYSKGFEDGRNSQEDLINW